MIHVGGYYQYYPKMHQIDVVKNGRGIKSYYLLKFGLKDFTTNKSWYQEEL